MMFTPPWALLCRGVACVRVEIRFTPSPRRGPHQRHTPYLRGVLGDGLFQRLDDASLLSDEPVLADLVSRDVSVEGLDAYLRDLTGDRLRGVDRSRLLTLGAAREADLRKADAAELAEVDSDDAAEATASDSDDVAAAAAADSGGRGSAGAA